MATRDPLQQTADAVLGVLGLAQVDWNALEPSDLLAAAGELARAKAVVEAALVQVAERVAANDASAAEGWASAKDFLTHVTGGRKGAGGTLLRIAERTAALPVVREAYVEGAVSTAQAGAIGDLVARLPRVPELREAAADRLVDLARAKGYDATDLARAMPEVVAELDPDGRLLGNDQALPQQERGTHRARFLSFRTDLYGGVWIKGYGTAEEAELVKATLMPLAAPQTTQPGACGGDPDAGHERDADGYLVGARCPDPVCAHDGRDRRDAGVRMWDALVEACTRLQSVDALPRDHGMTTRLLVITSYDHLSEGLGEGLLPSGDRLSAAAVRRLACDAEIIPAVIGAESQVLDVGRAQRLVTNPIWVALVLRDRCCAFPGCTRPPIACDAHHIQHWADGGATSLDNLILLCRRHHTLTHHTPWTVAIDPITRQPVWTPPPQIDINTRLTYVAGRPPPHAA